MSDHQVVRPSSFSLLELSDMNESLYQYGDLFSFKMMGRTMTVALGPKGNNLSLGGKVSQVSAEDAYTVSSYSSVADQH
jgi:hypothetical protein